MRPFHIGLIRERGSVLVVALLILVLLTLIGISATTNTDIETLIAGNEKFHKIAFYNADSGIFPSAKLISTVVDTQAEPVLSSITYVENDESEETGGTLLDEIMGYVPCDDKKDIQFTPSGYEVEVDIHRTGAKNLVGGGIEFAAGAEGIGSGSGGGVAIFYHIDSKGDGPANSLSNVVADYRKVVGVPGGL